MYERYTELAFDALVALATGVAVTAYMLGVLLDPIPAVLIGLALVVLGTIALIPPERRLMTGIIGASAVIGGGGGVPRVIASISGITNELPLTVALCGLVLLLSFAARRATIFGRATDLS